MIKLAENRYGKSLVRLMQVNRTPEGNTLREWTVQVMLTGDFDSAHYDGDNANVLPTDTMKNTIYYVARRSTAVAMEDYARELIDFLLGRNPQVASVTVSIEAALWKRIMVDGKPHATSFMRGSNELQTTTVNRERGGPLNVTSGLRNLIVMKTSDSAFTGFIKDELTTLRETEDRLFCTAVMADWSYSDTALDYDSVRANMRETMLSTFADHRSRSVQQTLWEMGRAALESAPAASWIELTMPNKHCLLVDLARFGEDNPNQIFVPTDEPAGHIQARVVRA